MSQGEEMFTKTKNTLRAIDNMMPRILDKTDPRYNQSAIDRLYTELKRLKSEVVNILAKQLSESKRENYKTLLKDLDDHIALFEPIISNGLAGGKRRNKRSYKKSRRCGKKSRRCRKKRMSRRK